MSRNQNVLPSTLSTTILEIRLCAGLLLFIAASPHFFIFPAIYQPGKVLPDQKYSLPFDDSYWPGCSAREDTFCCSVAGEQGKAGLYHQPCIRPSSWDDDWLKCDKVWFLVCLSHLFCLSPGQSGCPGQSLAGVLVLTLWLQSYEQLSKWFNGVCDPLVIMSYKIQKWQITWAHGRSQKYYLAMLPLCCRLSN